MSSKFDHKALAHSIGMLLATAQSNIARGGASIATQRLIDYSSGEFAKLKPKQLGKVLKAMDGKFKKKLLKDGYGNTIGYAYSNKIFMSLKDNQKSSNKPSPSSDSEGQGGGGGGGGQEDFAAKYAGQYMKAQAGAPEKDTKKSKETAKSNAQKPSKRSKK